MNGMGSEDSLHLIVIGAGLAGLGAAVATKVANPNHQVTILESVKELAEIGVCISFPGISIIILLILGENFEDIMILTFHRLGFNLHQTQPISSRNGASTTNWLVRPHFQTHSLCVDSMAPKSSPMNQTSKRKSMLAIMLPSGECIESISSER